MFDFLKNKKPGFVYDQAVIVSIDLAGFEDFGTREQQSELKQLERNLERVLPERSGVDGDEFGDGEALIYIYGPNADEIFKAVGPILKNSNFNHIDITLQYGLPDDPKTKERRFTL